MVPVVDTHPDPDTIQDLRLLSPWPELIAEVTALGNLDELPDHQHSHVPYILLLLHYLQKWMNLHEGQAPQNFAEKTQLRNMVKAGARTNNAEGGEENYDEAAGAVLKSIAPFSLKTGCAEMFEHEACISPTAQSANFWFIASAIRSFYQTHGVLPLPGSLPDMKAQSADYIKLQNIYRAKARKDVAEVVGQVRRLEEELPIDTDRKRRPVPEEEIEAFCKNAAHVKILHGDVLSHVRFEQGETTTTKRIRQELRDPDTLLPVLLGFDFPNRSRLKDLMTAISTDPLQDYGGKSDDHPNIEHVDKIFTELERVGTRELHNISSLTGGMVAQEAIKILTRQYVPVDNSCVFDGIQSRAQLFKL